MNADIAETPKVKAAIINDVDYNFILSEAQKAAIISTVKYPTGLRVKKVRNLTGSFSPITFEILEGYELVVSVRNKFNLLDYHPTLKGKNVAKALEKISKSPKLAAQGAE